MLRAYWVLPWLLSGCTSLPPAEQDPLRSVSPLGRIAVAADAFRPLSSSDPRADTARLRSAVSGGWRGADFGLRLASEANRRCSMRDLSGIAACGTAGFAALTVVPISAGVGAALGAASADIPASPPAPRPSHNILGLSSDELDTGLAARALDSLRRHGLAPIVALPPGAAAPFERARAGAIDSLLDLRVVETALWVDAADPSGERLAVVLTAEASLYRCLDGAIYERRRFVSRSDYRAKSQWIANDHAALRGELGRRLDALASELSDGWMTAKLRPRDGAGGGTRSADLK